MEGDFPNCVNYYFTTLYTKLANRSQAWEHFLPSYHLTRLTGKEETTKVEAKNFVVNANF